MDHLFGGHALPQPAFELPQPPQPFYAGAFPPPAFNPLNTTTTVAQIIQPLFDVEQRIQQQRQQQQMQQGLPGLTGLDSLLDTLRRNMEAQHDHEAALAATREALTRALGRVRELEFVNAQLFNQFNDLKQRECIFGCGGGGGDERRTAASYTADLLMVVRAQLQLQQAQEQQQAAAARGRGAAAIGIDGDMPIDLQRQQQQHHAPFYVLAAEEDHDSADEDDAEDGAEEEEQVGEEGEEDEEWGPAGDQDQVEIEVWVDQDGEEQQQQEEEDDLDDEAREQKEDEIKQLRAANDNSTAVGTRFTRACTICYIANPCQRAALACGHIFCVACAYQISVGSARRLRCPTCRMRTNYIRIYENEEEEEKEKEKEKEGDKEENSSRKRPIVADEDDQGPPAKQAPAQESN